MRQDLPATPARTLIRALGLQLHGTATVQDLYSRPVVRAPAALPRPSEERQAA